MAIARAAGGTEGAQEEKEAKLCRSVAVEDLGPCKKRFAVEVSPETVRAEVDKLFEELKKTAVIPGFRPGKVPRDVVVRRFAKSVEGDAREDLVERALAEAVESKGFSFLRSPKVDEKNVQFAMETGLKFSAEVLTWPQFEVKDYHGLKLRKPKVSVTEAEVDAGITGLQKRKAQWVPVEGDVQPQDLVIGRVTLTVDGQEPIVKEGFTVLLEEGMVGEIPVADLAGHLAGKSLGAEVQIPVEIPVTFAAEALRGKKGRVAILVEEVKRARLPAADDELAKSYQLGSLQALRDSVRRALQKERDWAADQELEHQIFEQLAQRMPFELPEEVVLAESYRILRQYERALFSRGFPPETVQEKVREVQKRSREEATRRLRSLFILERIAEKERIFASEQEIDRYIAAMAAASNQRAERLHAELEREGSLPEIRTQLRHAKVMESLKSKAEITEKEA